MGLNEQRSLDFRPAEAPSGLEVELAALREHVALGSYSEFASAEALRELRLAVQLCSVGVGEIPVCPRGIPTPAALVVAEFDLEPFVERRIRGWARLN